MLLLLLWKKGNALSICYRADLRAQVPNTMLTGKHKHKTKITQIINNAVPNKQYNINVKAIDK
jgi:hypothetical protein